MKPIYEYIDYRCFLRERFSDLKNKNPLFSFRAFNRLAGLRSSATLKLVIDGKRNLAANGIQRVAKGFKLNETEGRYFKYLVFLNQSKDHEEKDRYFRQLCEFRQFLSAKPLTVAQYNFLSHWYYVAILELLRLDANEPCDARWIQKRINPSVGLREMKKALGDLQHLGLIEGDAKTGYRRKDGMLATDHEVKSISLVNFHREMCRMAERAVMEEKARHRDFSTLTIATSEDVFRKIKTEMQKFRRKLHALLEQESGQPKSVVSHINFQLFMLSQPNGGL